VIGIDRVFFCKKTLQFFHIKILADFSKKIAKSIEFTPEKTHICIVFPIFFPKKSLFDDNPPKG
jgi:hypothetical protein